MKEVFGEDQNIGQEYVNINTWWKMNLLKFKRENFASIASKISALETQLEELRSKKWDTADFHKLELSLDKHRAKQIFVDMQEYTQGRLDQIQKHIAKYYIHVDKIDTVDRIHHIMKMLDERVTKSEIDGLKDKIKAIEWTITKVWVLFWLLALHEPREDEGISIYIE